MADSSFHADVACVAAGMIAPELAGERLADAATFVDQQVSAMPAHLRFGVEAGGVFLRTYARLRRRAAFNDLDNADRQRLVAEWLSSPLPPVGQYVRVLRSLALYAAQEPLS